MCDADDSGIDLHSVWCLTRCPFFRYLAPFARTVDRASVAYARDTVNGAQPENTQMYILLITTTSEKRSSRGRIFVHRVRVGRTNGIECAAVEKCISYIVLRVVRSNI